MSRKLYIGISGKMGSGKTTLTDGLKRVLPNFKIDVVSLAKPIKDIQFLIYDNLGLELKGEKDRDLLIALGMWGRGKDSNFWLEQAVKKFEKSDADIVICDDVRFENEAEWFGANGLLMRLDGEQRGPNVDESRKDDATETNLDEYNFKHVVSNRNGVENTLLDAIHVISKHVDAHTKILGGMVNHMKEG